MIHFASHGLALFVGIMYGIHIERKMRMRRDLARVWRRPR